MTVKAAAKVQHNMLQVPQRLHIALATHDAQLSVLAFWLVYHAELMLQQHLTWCPGCRDNNCPHASAVGG
jgi:hypothetical protein